MTFEFPHELLDREGSEPEGERLVGVGVERSVAEEWDVVRELGRVKLGRGFIAERTIEVDAGDFRSERGGERMDPDVSAFSHGRSVRPVPSARASCHEERRRIHAQE